MGAGSHRKKHTRSGASSLRTLYLGPILAYEADRWQRRYAVLRYDGVFEGLAWIIEDSTGANDFQDFLDSLALDPDILWFEPDFEVTLPPSNARGGGSGQQVPWSVAAIGGQSSWAVSGDGQGDVNVDLYILDTGIANADNNDPNDDLALVESLDFRDSTLALDPVGHGTHIAGIAAAVDDSVGLVGIAPGARIHNYKVLNDDGQTEVSVVIAAVEYITGQKLANPATPMVVNISLGENVGTPDYSALDEAITASIEAGVVYVISAGNDDTDASLVTPAKVQQAITVGSYDGSGRFSWFSNWGSKVDLLAPGEDIVSLDRSTNGPGTPMLMSGTSMSAAHVSGAAALYLGQHPSATPAQVKQALLDAAKPNVEGEPPGTTNLSVWVGTHTVQITKAKWDEKKGKGKDKDKGKSKLKLDGKGSPGMTVTLTNAATGAFLGTTTVKDHGPKSGKWKIDLKGLATVPCRVRATLGNVFDERTVKKAPNTCQ